MFSKNKRYSFKTGIPANFINAQCFSLRYRKSDSGFHCAIVVGKRVDKRAVVRHLLKRRFANALQEIVSSKVIDNDLVFFLHKKAVGKEYQDIKLEIKKTLETVKII